MKKLSVKKMAELQGGKVSARTCMLLGGATLVFAVAQQWAWAFGTWTGAAGAGCFDD